MSDFFYMAFDLFGQKLAVRAPRFPGAWQSQLPALLGPYAVGQFDETEPTLTDYDLVDVEYVEDTLPWHVIYDKYTHMLADEVQLLTHLEWRLFTAGVWYGPAALSLHAGAVANASGTLVLPGTSGSGKTTLTLALTTLGWDYLTDDICLIEPHSNEWKVMPCNRCCHLDAHSVDLLAQHGLTLARPIDRLPEHHIPPMGSHEAPIRWIVRPQFQPDAPLSFSRMTQAETAATLIDAGLRQVNRTVREQRATAIAVAIHATGFRLSFPDLDSGLAALQEITRNDPA
jgi:hypothetical protein